MTAALKAALKGPKISYLTAEVTPAIAQRWLDENNRHNRALKPLAIARYASDMRAGRWHYNGEAIKFDTNGVLLDGQNRLSAIVETGIPQTFLVVRGLAPESQKTMDQGSARTPAEQLFISDILANNTVAAAIRIYILWQTDKLFSDHKGKMGITTTQVVEWAENEPDQMQNLRTINDKSLRKVPATPSVTLAIALELHRIDWDDAAYFIAGLSGEVGVATGSPVLALRNLLLSYRAKRITVSARDQIGLFVTAWNAHRDRRSLSHLRRPNGGSFTKANFPTPR